MLTCYERAMAWTAGVGEDGTAGAIRTVDRTAIAPATAGTSPSAGSPLTGCGTRLGSSSWRTGGARWNRIIPNGATPSKGMSTSPTSSWPSGRPPANSRAASTARCPPTRPGGNPLTPWRSRPTGWRILTNSERSGRPPGPTGQCGSRSPVRCRRYSALPGVRTSTGEPLPPAGLRRVSGMLAASRSAPGSGEVTASGTRSPAIRSQARYVRGRRVGRPS
jgi:hypothetical protein